MERQPLRGASLLFGKFFLKTAWKRRYFRLGRVPCTPRSATGWCDVCTKYSSCFIFDYSVYNGDLCAICVPWSYLKRAPGFPNFLNFMQLLRKIGQNNRMQSVPPPLGNPGSTITVCYQHKSFIAPSSQIKL